MIHEAWRRCDQDGRGCKQGRSRRRKRRVPVQEESAVRDANFAFSFCASSAFCFWKSAGAAWESAARARKTRAESFVENMVNLEHVRGRMALTTRDDGRVLMKERRRDVGK